jgi:hypothetical protein
MSAVEILPLTGSIVNITNNVFNHATISSVSGVNVGGAPLSNKVPFVRCIEDGGIFKQNRGYILKADQSGYEGLFPIHTHTPEDEVNDGGAYFWIRKLNAHHLLDFNNQSAHKSQFSSVSTLLQGTSTIADTILSGASFILLTSNYNAAGSVGYSATLMRGGLRLDFSYPFVFIIKQVLSHNVDLVYRGGCNLAYTHNLAGVVNQVGIEGCTSSSSNYQAVSGNGTSRTGAPLTSSNLAPGVVRGYKIQYFPADKIIFRDGAGNEVIKNDNLPAVSSATDSDATLRIGLNTSTSTAKALKYYASVLLGKIYESNPAIGEWL